MPDGTIVLELRRRWRDRTTHVIFDPGELLERLAALVPKPRVNLVLYHGVFAPRARPTGHGPNSCNEVLGLTCWRLSAAAADWR